MLFIITLGIFFYLDIKYLRETLPSTIEDEFYEYLKTVSANDVRLFAIAEGSVVFPRYSLYNFFLFSIKEI